jgi:D-glycero-alpha-D-manno-heptose 1-phosphate guanylyltransferase
MIMLPADFKTGPQNYSSMELECIILAGGLGTRLRSAVPDLPKCMAPLKNKPFLQYVIDYLLEQKVNSFIFALGYMNEPILEFLSKQYPNLNYKIATEEEPLGTGGAIKNAIKLAEKKNVLVLNGDTMFKINVEEIFNFHNQQNASCTLSLKPMQNFDRYGVVEINKEGYIQSFKEKQHYEKGLINGGVYVLNKTSFLQLPLPDKFSFEKEYLENYFASQKMLGLVQDNYFIDIGIPEDYKRAEIEL